MRLVIAIWVCAVVYAPPSAAQDRCAADGLSIACEMALQYVAKAGDMLPMRAERFGTPLIAESLKGDGPRVTLSAVVDLPAAEVAKLLEEGNDAGAHLRLFLDGGLVFAVCDTAEGSAFINAGGEVVLILANADRKPVATASVQSCRKE